MTFSQLLQIIRQSIVPSPAKTTFDCPNCWGTQQWENEQKTATVDLRKDLSRIGRARKGFIQRFVDRYLPQ